MHVTVRTAVAREVAEVEGRPREVGDDERNADDKRPHGFTERKRLIGEREADVLPSGFGHDPDHHDEHDDVDDRPRPVDEDADRLHVGDEERRLRGPHGEEACPAEGREPENVVFRVDLPLRKEVEDAHHERGRGEIGLNAVPDDRDDPADERGNVRAVDAEGHAGHDGDGNRVPAARFADQVREPLHDENAQKQRREHLPAREAE